MARDVIVIGGGVIGCSVAWRLAQAGLKVTVIERGRVGCEASRAAAGMLSPQGGAESGGPFFDLCLRSRAMYREFGQEVTEASGIDIEYKDEGTLFVVVEGEDQEEKTRWASWQFEAGLPLEHLSADEVLKIEPAVTQSATRAIFLPQEHQVENRRLMDALEVAIKRAGVELIEGSDVTAITTRPRQGDRRSVWQRATPGRFGRRSRWNVVEPVAGTTRAECQNHPRSRPDDRGERSGLSYRSGCSFKQSLSLSRAATAAS